MITVNYILEYNKEYIDKFTIKITTDNVLVIKINVNPLDYLYRWGLAKRSKC